MKEKVILGLFDVIHTTAAQILETVIYLDQATFRRDPSAARLHTELHARLWILAEAIDALPPEVVRARRDVPLTELARLPGFLERPDVQPSVRLLRRTLETPMRNILRLIPRQARVPKDIS
jgi:hypothetical protein